MNDMEVSFDTFLGPNISLSFFKKNTLSKNVKDLSISPHISHPPKPSLPLHNNSNNNQALSH